MDKTLKLRLEVLPETLSGNTRQRAAAMWSFFSRDPAKDFAFDVGEPVKGLEDRSFWRIHKGLKKVCNLFCFSGCNFINYRYLRPSGLPQTRYRKVR